MSRRSHRSWAGTSSARSSAFCPECSARLPREVLEYCAAARRQTVADFKALGETEFFQLSDATLEWRDFDLHLPREHMRHDRRLIGDELQVACRPGRCRRGVDPGQPRDDRLELCGLWYTLPKGDARVVAGETELDAQERALARDRRAQLLDRHARAPHILRRDVVFLDDGDAIE